MTRLRERLLKISDDARRNAEDGFKRWDDLCARYGGRPAENYLHGAVGLQLNWGIRSEQHGGIAIFERPSAHLHHVEANHPWMAPGGVDPPSVLSHERVHAPTDALVLPVIVKSPEGIQVEVVPT